jgi:hypothetical protein
MSPIRVVVEEEAVPEDYIPRIAEEISYIRNCPQGDVPNVQIDSWRSESTEGIPITDGMRLSRSTYSSLLNSGLTFCMLQSESSSK